MTLEEALIVAEDARSSPHDRWDACEILAAEVRWKHQEIERLRAECERWNEAVMTGLDGNGQAQAIVNAARGNT